MPALALLAFGPPPGSALFPYTTLFRSRARRRGPRVRRADDARQRDRPRDRRARHGAGGGRRGGARLAASRRSEEHTSELQSPCKLVCRLLLEKKKKTRERMPRIQTTHG